MPPEPKLGVDVFWPKSEPLVPPPNPPDVPPPNALPEVPNDGVDEPNAPVPAGLAAKAFVPVVVPIKMC